MASTLASDTELDCPSAQPDMAHARPIGLLDGSADEPRIAYLKKGADPLSALRSRLGTVPLTQVVRFGARCEEGRCKHYAAGQCSLGARVAAQLPAVVDVAPSCQLRGSCRWHREQGVAACLRCPQVVTMIPDGDTPLNQVA